MTAQTAREVLQKTYCFHETDYREGMRRLTDAEINSLITALTASGHLLPDGQADAAVGALPDELIRALTVHKRQIDETGEFVGVSHQAVDEMVAWYRAALVKLDALRPFAEAGALIPPAAPNANGVVMTPDKLVIVTFGDAENSVSITYGDFRRAGRAGK